MENIINDLNVNSSIVAIISSIVTGIVIGIISYCATKRSIEATLKVASDNIEFQKYTFDENYKYKQIENIDKKLFSIYESILHIERNYDMTSMYIESDTSIDKNNYKYVELREELDRARVICDLYFYKELSDAMRNINSSINQYWGHLDYYFRHKQSGNNEEAYKNQEKAYVATREIQSCLNEIKQIIRNMISQSA